MTHDCSTLNYRHSVYITALAKKEVVSICDAETTANSWSFEGEKSLLRSYGNYLLRIAFVNESQ